MWANNIFRTLVWIPIDFPDLKNDDKRDDFTFLFAEYKVRIVITTKIYAIFIHSFLFIFIDFHWFSLIFVHFRSSLIIFIPFLSFLFIHFHSLWRIDLFPIVSKLYCLEQYCYQITQGGGGQPKCHLSFFCQFLNLIKM